jgi:hypothetical protein
MKNCLKLTLSHFKTLTPWGRALLEKITVFPLLKKFLAFYGKR